MSSRKVTNVMITKAAERFYARIQKEQAQGGLPVVISGEKWYVESAAGRKCKGIAQRQTVGVLWKAGWLKAVKLENMLHYEFYIA